MSGRQGAEDAVEKEKGDAKIGIHMARCVNAVMMNIVKTPGAPEPAIDQRHAGHPEIAKVHGVVEKTEGEERPDHEVAQHNCLVNGRHLKEKHDAATKSQKDG